MDRSKQVVLVPYYRHIEDECDEGLKALELVGVTVVRQGGVSAIDAARNILVSDALEDGFESIMFIDSDIEFLPQDAIRLLDSPLSVVCGVYAKKAQQEVSSVFEETKEVVFGEKKFERLRYAGAGFLRIRFEVLRGMIEKLELPACNVAWGRPMWPFFMPMVAESEHGSHYLTEDWAFSHRLNEAGYAILADMSIRLWHWGRQRFSWEEAGNAVTRCHKYALKL